MIRIKEALEIIKNNAQPLGTEKVPLSLSINRVLAENLKTDSDFPPFNKSAVDGYACKKSDLDKELIVKGMIKAGDVWDSEIGAGECLKIMTGATVPEGCDCVVMVEHVSERGESGIKINNPTKVNNICFKGEDKKKDELILSKGQLIKKNHIGILASAGMHTLEVYRQPNITVFSTGSELVEPEDVPKNGQIRNANGPQLLAQLTSLGLNSLYGGITEDDEMMMEVELSRSIENFDGIILSGGVSAGDYDFVPQILKRMGFTIQFHKINIKPGKPVLFATRGDKFCFGLPGNPVSSYVQFELLVKPYLLQVMGNDYVAEELTLMAGEDISRKNADTESFIPVKLNTQSQVVKIPYHGSGHFFALGEATALLHFDRETDLIKKGEWARIRPI